MIEWGALLAEGGRKGKKFYERHYWIVELIENKLV
jgi:hypothetical protein